MSKILELREKRAKAWEAAKTFLDTKRGSDGLVSAEDAQMYDRMEEDIMNLGKEIQRLERQEALDAELNRPINTPIIGKPSVPGMHSKEGRATDEYKKAICNALIRQDTIDAYINQPINTPINDKPSETSMKTKEGRATDEYKKAFWNAMRSKAPTQEVMNSLSVGTDSEGGFLVPDEFERTLVQTLEEENVFRQLAKIVKTSSGDRKIPVVTTKGSAAWLDEGEEF